MIETLSLEQKGKLVCRCQHWQDLTLKTEPMDIEQAQTAIHNAYFESGFAEPEIWYFRNPWVAVEALALTADSRFTRRKMARGKFRKRVWEHFHHLIERQLSDGLKEAIWQEIRAYQPSLFSQGIDSLLCVTDELNFQLQQLEERLQLEPLCIDLCLNLHWADLFTGFHCFWDFCISELGVQYDARKWKVLQSLVKNCGFLLMFEEVCVLIERPCRLLMDSQGNFHGEAESAIAFADGYGISVHHGLHTSRLEED